MTEVSFQELDIQRVLPVFLLGISFNLTGQVLSTTSGIPDIAMWVMVVVATVVTVVMVVLI